MGYQGRSPWLVSASTGAPRHETFGPKRGGLWRPILATGMGSCVRAGCFDRPPTKLSLSSGRQVLLRLEFPKQVRMRTWNEILPIPTISEILTIVCAPTVRQEQGSYWQNAKWKITSTTLPKLKSSSCAAP